VSPPVPASQTYSKRYATGGFAHGKVLEQEFLSSASLSLLTLGDGTVVPVEAPRLLDWYTPKDLAWHYTINRFDLSSFYL
jgi:hypothetical protein